MNHARLRDSLSEYLDAHLGERRRAAVERHLAGCNECRAELDALRGVVRHLQELRTVEAPSDLAERVVARLRAGEATPTWRTWVGDRLTRFVEAAWLAPLSAAVVGVGVALASQNLQILEPRSPASATPRMASSAPRPDLPAPARFPDAPRFVATPLPTAPSLAVPRELRAAGAPWGTESPGPFRGFDLAGRWTSGDPTRAGADCLAGSMSSLRGFPGGCLEAVAWETAAR